jgi:hypothetical protein
VPKMISRKESFILFSASKKKLKKIIILHPKVSKKSLKPTTTTRKVSSRTSQWKLKTINHLNSESLRIVRVKNREFVLVKTLKYPIKILIKTSFTRVGKGIINLIHNLRLRWTSKTNLMQ